MHAKVAEALRSLARQGKIPIDYVFKGMNPLTEHFGALQAEVCIGEDATTFLNARLLEKFQDADIVLVAGEAFSHCVRATLQQMVDNIGKEHIRKLVMLTDCMSCIPAARDGSGNVVADFPGMTAAWLKEMEALGVSVSDSVSFWK